MLAPKPNTAAISTYCLSEQAISVNFGNDISENLLQQINLFNQLLHQQPFTGFRTTVPAYTTLTVFYDPLQVALSALKGADSFEKVSNYLSQLQNTSAHTNPPPARTVTIPVCYGGSFGPDLDEVAALTNLSAHEVITLHSSAIYKVYMIGFVPGFAYLGGMPQQLAAPRKATPRQAIPAGSVGIAGKQTGVYPLQTPGGWQLIGRTPLNLFNPALPEPALLKAGDEVIFKPISQHEFDLSRNHADTHY